MTKSIDPFQTTYKNYYLPPLVRQIQPVYSELTLRLTTVASCLHETQRFPENEVSLLKTSLLKSILVFPPIFEQAFTDSQDADFLAQKRVFRQLITQLQAHKKYIEALSPLFLEISSCYETLLERLPNVVETQTLSRTKTFHKRVAETYSLATAVLGNTVSCVRNQPKVAIASLASYGIESALKTRYPLNLTESEYYKSIEKITFYLPFLFIGAFILYKLYSRNQLSTNISESVLPQLVKLNSSEDFSEVIQLTQEILKGTKKENILIKFASFTESEAHFYLSESGEAHRIIFLEKSNFLERKVILLHELAHQVSYEGNIREKKAAKKVAYGIVATALNLVAMPVFFLSYFLRPATSYPTKKRIEYLVKTIAMLPAFSLYSLSPGIVSGVRFYSGIYLTYKLLRRLDSQNIEFETDKMFMHKMDRETLEESIKRYKNEHPNFNIRDFLIGTLQMPQLILQSLISLSLIWEGKAPIASDIITTMFIAFSIFMDFPATHPPHEHRRRVFEKALADRIKEV